MTRLKLSLGCWSYDRTRALLDGAVRPEGIELVYLDLPAEEVFFRMIKFREFDIAEMSLSSYTASLFRDKRDFVAIPIFPSRSFRHSCIFVNASAGIVRPADLIGKRVGLPEFQMTSAVWIRGILQEYYGVPADSIDYFTGGEEQPGREEKQPIRLSKDFKVTAIAAHKTLSAMLRDGEIDALYTARTPSTFDGQTVTRLFRDFGTEEVDFWRKSRIFPIMHTIVIRREVYEANRWIAQSLYKAFVEAKVRAYNDLLETGAFKVMIPHLARVVEETRSTMGDDFWPYGLSENRETLSTFLRYHWECGLSAQLLSPEQLFAPETLEASKI